MRDAEDAQEELDNKLFGGRVLEVSSSSSPQLLAIVSHLLWRANLVQCGQVQHRATTTASDGGWGIPTDNDPL